MFLLLLLLLLLLVLLLLLLITIDIGKRSITTDLERLFQSPSLLSTHDLIKLEGNLNIAQCMIKGEMYKRSKVEADMHIANITASASTGPILPLSLVNKIFEYIHKDLQYIVHRCMYKWRLPLGIIMQCGLEDYFADVLLSKRFRVKLCEISAKIGSLNTLKWARDHGCVWTLGNLSGTADEAAGNGHLHVLQWARANGCPWNGQVCTQAARRGHLHVLQWARANGCQWNIWTCSAAASEGHLDILEWARSKGCLWSSSTTSEAASNGHLHILEWATANGCSLDVSSFSTVSIRKPVNWEIIQWLIDKQCPMEGAYFNFCEFAVTEEKWELVQLAINRGCSCPDYIRDELVKKLK